MDNCPFRQIIARSTHAEILYKNNDLLCILNTNPIHYSHALVIPKRHCQDLIDLPPKSFAGMMQAVHTVARAQKDSLALEGLSVFSNNGRVAGQSVFHFHSHVTPRFADENTKFVLELKKYRNGEIAELRRAFVNRSNNDFLKQENAIPCLPTSSLSPRPMGRRSPLPMEH